MFAPYAALAFGVLALTLSSLFIRWADAPGPVTSFYRMAIAALVLVPLIMVHFKKVGRPDLRLLFLPAVGGLFSALDHSLWSTAIGYTRIANATLLNNVSPVWVALFAWLVWRERLHVKFWLGLMTTLAGAVVVLSSDLALSPELTGGNLLALLSSVFYAGYFLVTQRARRRLDALTYVWLVDIFSALSLLGFTRALNMPLSGYDTQTYLVFLAAALISQVGGYFAIAYTMGHLPASIVSPTLVAQPVLTTLLAIPLAGELLRPVQWLGALAVVGGILWVNVSQPKPV